MRLTGATLILGSLAAVAANGQSVISAHSGVVHYVDGSAYIENKPVDMKFGHFPDIKVNETFRTEEGRAEILLTPGSFLRLAENSEVRMLSNQLSDTRFELLQGEILVESVDFTKDSAASKIKGNVISVLCDGTTTILEKAGLYQFTSDPSRLRVYEGEALVKTASDQLTLKHGKETQLGGTLMAEKFDAKVGDELTRWSSRRSGYLATANVSSARSLSSGSNAWSSYAGGYLGGWAFNPGFGMYTFVPMGGIGFSPFGYNYFSPYTVGQYYPYYGGYGGGYYYPGNSYYNSGLSGGANGANLSRRSTGNYGGNSAIRGTIANHSRGPVGVGSSGQAGSVYSGSRSGGVSGVSASSGSFGGIARGGGGGGLSSAGSGGGASAGGSARGGGSSGGSARGR